MPKVLPATPVHLLLPLIVAASIALMLIRPRGVAEAWWIGGGVVLLLGLRLVSLKTAGSAIVEGTDVYLFLIGMMLLSELAREQGVFDWLASLTVRRAGGSPARLFLLVYAAGTAVTIFLSNDATAIVLTPAILTAVRRAKVHPPPYLFACALVANAASFVLPISNPANLVVFRGGMPSLGAWLASFGVPSMLSIAATYAAMRWIFHKQITGVVEESEEAAPLTGHGRLVVWGLACVVLVLLTASSLKRDLGLPTFAAAVAVAIAVSVRSRASPLRTLREISWSTLALVAGLFIMVDAIEGAGALPLARRAFAWTEGLGPAGAFLASFTIGTANNLINNLPLGLIVGSTLQAAHAKGLLANAALIGVDLGPNLSITGSLATILWLIALRKEKQDVGFWDFLKVGAVAMPVALFFSTAAALIASLWSHRS